MRRFGAFWISTLAAAIAAASVVSGATPAGATPRRVAHAGASTGEFSAVPAHFDPAIPASRAYFIRRIARGGAFYDQVAISNLTSRELHLYVYAVEALTGTTSGVVFTDRRDPRHEAGAWVQSSVSSVTLAPGARTDAGFLVRIPHNARPGDHVAGIAVENASPQTSGGRFSVTEILRAVVGIDIIVTGRTHYRLRPTHLGLAPLPATRIPALGISLYNYGDKLCRPTVSASLEGPGVQRPMSVTRRLDTILPQDRIAYPLFWPRPLAAGQYWARVHTSGCGQPTGLAEAIALRHGLTGTRAHPTGLRTAAAVSDRVRYALAVLALVVLALFWRPLLAVLTWPAGHGRAIRRRGTS